jgi:hypothetical protein
MNTNDYRQTAHGERRDHASPVAGQIGETAGVVLAAVFTMIAGVGTILQFVAFFR